MNDSLFIKSTIEINAPATKVWEVLTNPEQTKKYMFGCEALSDWKRGSPLLWKGIQEGKEIIFVKGAIVDIEPEKNLVYTVIDPNGKYEDVPENYLTVTYNLVSGNGQTTLTVTQGDYAKVADGEARYKHTMEGGGWEPILDGIKKVAEQ